ncbi:MAG: hypothetical protein E7129_01195 [Rikenellaceae bacterium]|nr:hypothetical protein [Rikenellaceae bacterium]
MKIFKPFGMAVVAVCMCVNFTACSSGDDANGGGDFAGERKLVKMVLQDGDDTETYLFSYDNQGRVTEARVGDEDWAWNHIFIWENNTVKVLDDGNHRCTYTIENGLVRSSYHPADFEWSYTQYYTYNLADKLVRESGEFYSNYTWDGDKLISMVGSGEFDVTYSYEDVYCKKGYLPMLSWDPIHMAHPELFGIKMTQLPVSSMNVMEENHNNDYSNKYQYEFTTDGYISKIIVKRVGGYHDGAIISWTLTWK